jgi:hypothetical protein
MMTSGVSRDPRHSEIRHRLNAESPEIQRED